LKPGKEEEMRSLKMLGFAAVAAAALMAFVGASSASATVLCKVEGTGATTGTICPSGSAYGAKTAVSAQLVAGTVAKLETAFKTIECKKSTTSGETSAEEAAEITGPEGTLTFTECNCEIKVLHAGTVSTGWISGTHNGTQKSTGNETTSQCSTIFGNVHCIYKTNATDLGTLTGGNPAKLDANASIPRLATDGLCAEKAVWHAEYEVTAPKPLFIAGGTVKCEEKAKANFTTESDCTAGINEEKEKGTWERILP
jgi:hypothetical protein